jgi:phage protein D
MSLARRAEVSVKWHSKDKGAVVAADGTFTDITRDLEPHLLGIAYTDNLTGAADDLTIELEDVAELWEGDWRPQLGDQVEATITAEPWLTQVDTLRFGRFAHDKITLALPPHRVTIQAISAPLATGLRRRKRVKTWSGVNLLYIAADICNRAGLDLDWQGDAGDTYKRREQRDKSDLEFLEELCKEVGRGVKVCESTQANGKFQISVFPEYQMDTGASVGTVDIRGGHVVDASFQVDDSARYGSVHVKFLNPRTGKVAEYEYKDPDNPDGQTLMLRLPLDNSAQGAAICKGKLRQANLFAGTGQLTVQGDPGLVAGVVFDLKGAHSIDGRFIVTKATHNPIGGYTTRIDVRRTVELY